MVTQGGDETSTEVPAVAVRAFLTLPLPSKSPARLAFVYDSVPVPADFALNVTLATNTSALLGNVSPLPLIFSVPLELLKLVTGPPLALK